VGAALAFGQTRGLEIAVRGGGHNPAGRCAVDGGLVIDLSRMRDVQVDPENGIATGIDASRTSMNWTRQSRIRIATPRLDERDGASFGRGVDTALG